jgi:hypothetical protein
MLLCYGIIGLGGLGILAILLTGLLFLAIQVLLGVLGIWRPEGSIRVLGMGQNGVMLVIWIGLLVGSAVKILREARRSR